MVEKRNCSFCGEDIEPGTGKMYIKKDGTVFYFCSNKCKKNRIDIGRVPRRTRWTMRYAELKASSLKREKKVEAPEKDEVKKPRVRKIQKKEIKKPVPKPKTKPQPKVVEKKPAEPSAEPKAD